MDIVMLAAGTSSRMGKANKMLLPYKGKAMVEHCCAQALAFLESYALESSETCNLIVVTGYRRRSVEKVLTSCKAFVGSTQAKLNMIIVNNADYRKGQFTSTKVGVSQVQEGAPFFISLADMPLVSAEHYKALADKLEGHDAVRPFYENKEDRVPGHPVLHAPCVKKAILEKPDDFTVRGVLKTMDINEVTFTDASWALDIDVPQNYQDISH